MIIWIASYPRSGNTLVRIILNSVFGYGTYSKYNDPADIGADRKMMELVGHKMLDSNWDDAYRKMKQSDRLYFVKTHNYPEDDSKAIYVARDGRCSIVSYWHYLIDFGKEHPLSDFIKGTVGFGSWSEHLNAWDPFNRNNTLLIKYEDLLTNPINEIDKIAKFTDLCVVKEWKNDFRSFQKINPRFFRQGDMAKGISEIKGDDFNLFWSLHGNWMEKTGYSEKNTSASENNKDIDTDTSNQIQDIDIQTRPSEKIKSETLQERTSADSNEDVDLSIVIATKDRAELLDEMLISLEYAADGVRYEVIVIEGGSADDTLEVLKSHGIKRVYSEVEYLGERRHAWSQLYNFGFSQANGRWAMYASDDIIFEEACISRALKILNQQPPNVAGGIFFYKNEIAEAGWDDYGIDYTFGKKLLMNYGIIRLDYFHEVGGLNEEYKFYCADGDLCFKLYESGRTLIPLPECFVIHNNVMDSVKQANADASTEDIRLYSQRWGHYGTTSKEPNGRRLMWRDFKEIPTVISGTLMDLKKASLWYEGQPLKLHLGCGQNHLEGYINIDFPSDEHTVQKAANADLFTDITTLAFPPASINEIRSHHVFEHFDRSTALALLCKWHEWLVPDGLLIIETPDLEASIQLLNSKEIAYKEKQGVLRHLFGSHEAKWAVHMDGWDGEKFKHMLSALGFEINRIEFDQWKMLRNITVTAKKSTMSDIEIIIENAKVLLRDSMVDESDSEEKKWDVWCNNFEKALHKMSMPDNSYSALPPTPPSSQETSQPSIDKFKTLVSEEKIGKIAGMIFSKDRAMQLDALLRSFYLNCKDKEFIDLKVIYKTSNLFHKSHYERLQATYDSVKFILESDFKKDLLSNLDGFEYVLFMVDDNIFIKEFSVSEIMNSLLFEKEAIGFSLRLGENIKFHYPSNSAQVQPELKSLNDKMLKVNWTNASGYFGYPLEVSSSVYRIKDLFGLLNDLDYQNPNTLESELARNRDRFISDKRYLLCYDKSIAFCNPANIVQDVFKENRKGNSKEYSPYNLGRLFDEGFVIDIHKYRDFLPEACHKEIGYDLIKVIKEDAERLSNIRIYYETPDLEQIGFDDSNSENNGEAALLPYLIRPGDVVFDVGANQGEWSRKILSVQPNVTLYAFEPVEPTFNMLTENLSDTKANIYNIALSKRSGKKTFYHYNQSSQSARMSTFYRRNSVEENLNIQPVSVRINTKSLSSFCKAHAVDKINFLKIDTEGAELDVLKGAETLLKNNKIEAIQFEYGGTYTDAGITLKEICALLTEYGYVIFRILPDGLAYISKWHESLENYRYSNYLAVSKNIAPGFEPMRGLSLFEEGDYPVVSIYMAVYNSGKYLKDTLDSILNQTFKNFELIISDDGSTDNSLDILRQYASKDKRIKLLKLKHSGVVNARNKAIKKCSPRSKYLMNHDSDDISLPNKLEKLIEYLGTHPEISIAGCFAEYFDDEENIKGQPPIEWKPDRIRETFGDMNSMIHSAAVIRREVFDKIGSYDKDFPAAQDYDFFARALMAGFEMANIPEALHRIRLHPESIGSAKSELQQDLAKKVQSTYAAFFNQRSGLIESESFKENSIHDDAMPDSGVKLHLGCGNIKIPDFINVDIDQNLSAVDVVDDITELNKFSIDSASLIYACHVLEHFNHNEILPILRRWMEVLKPNGELRISVPDIDRIIKIYHKNWQHFQTPPSAPWIGLIYGGQGNQWDFHKTGFNFIWLKHLLEQVGFTEIEEYPHSPHWLGLQDASLAHETFNEYISLNVKAKKPFEPSKGIK